MTWWIWCLIGLGLCAAELFLPLNFFLMVLGSSAIIIGVITSTGLITASSVQLGLFTIVAIALLPLARKFSKKIALRSTPDVDSLVGELVEVLVELPAAGRGQVSLRGAPWQAVNGGTATIKAASRARVVAVNGITLTVEAI